MLFRLLASWLALLCLPLTTAASTIQRCEDTGGKIAFTYHGCPGDEKMTSRPRSGASAAAPSTPPSSTRPARQPSPSSRTNAIVVVGQRDDGCGNRLSADKRRRAIINRQTPPGMTRRDVESLLGRPDKVISKNSETRLVYEEKKGRSNQVTLDKDGCVKGKH